MSSVLDLGVYLLIGACLLAIAAVIVIRPGPRNVAGRIVVFAVRVLITLTAWVAALFDLLIPINTKNGRVSRARLFLWCAFNLVPVAAWVTLHQYAGDTAVDIVGGFNVMLALLNMLFLAGAFWALREGIDIMNADKARRHRQFTDLSTAKNIAIVCATALLSVPQIAASLQWLQHSHGLELISIRSSLGFAYLDYLAVVTGASRQVSYSSSLLGWSCEHALKAFTSVFVVSTFIGFVQQHLAFKRMIEGLITKTDNTVLPLLRYRFVRAPSAIKSYVRSAFRAETDDAKRVKLVRLAVDRHAYSFPASFVRNYPRLSQRVREEGAKIVSDFVERKRHQFDNETLMEVVTAAHLVASAGRLQSPDDQQRVARIVLPCLEFLTDPDRYDANSVQAAHQAARYKSVQAMLWTLLRAGADEPSRDRASRQLIKSSSPAFHAGDAPLPAVYGRPAAAACARGPSRAHC